MSVDDSAAVSPPAPALPPRRYRGETDLTMVDRLPPTSRGTDCTNGESTLPHDTYANQLRRQARRYQQSRGSSFSHPRPPPPDWKPPPPPPPLLPQDPSLEHPDVGSESELWKSRAAASVSGPGYVSGGRKSSIPLMISSSIGAPESEHHQAVARVSLFAAESPVSDTGLENKTSAVQKADVNITLTSRERFDRHSPLTTNHRLGSSSSLVYGHPTVDVVSGYDRYYGVGDHLTTSLSRSFSSVIPTDIGSSEGSAFRRSSQPTVARSPQSRIGTRSPETSTINVESSDIERCSSSSFLSTCGDNARALSSDHKVWSSSCAELPAGKRPSDVEVPSEITPSSKSPDSSGSVTESQPEVSVTSLAEPRFFRRHRFPSEEDCARQAEVVAGLLRRADRDDTLVNVLSPSAGHRTATDLVAKVLGVAESEQRCYDGVPELLRLRLCARDTRHVAL